MTRTSSRKGVMPARFVAAAAALAFVLLGSSFGSTWLRAKRQEEAPSAHAMAERNRPMGVGALGRLEPGWKIYQIAPATLTDGARVEELAVEEGDLVQRGTLLATLHTYAFREAARGEARTRVQIAQARLALVQAGTKPEDIAAQEALIARHRASVQYSSAVYRRSQNLFANRAMSTEELDLRKMELLTQQASLLQAEKTLAAMKVIRWEDIKIAEAELANAETGVQKAEADLAHAKILSPLAGRVLKIHAREGERVSENGLAEIGDTAAMHAVAEVYEQDAPRVKIGQRARVKLQSLPHELHGEVLHIGWKIGRRVVLDNDPVKDTDARVVEVRVKLDAPSSNLVAALSHARVEVRIDAPPVDASLADAPTVDAPTVLRAK